MRVFLIVWVGQWLSWLGSGMSAFALGVWVYERTGSSTQFAAAALAGLLPRILVAPLAGALVDRWERRRVLIASDLGAGAVTLAMALLLWAGMLEVWQIYLGAALSAVCGAFQRPAYAASVTLLVPADQYGRANGLIGLARSSSDLAAPILAGTLMAAVGPAPILALDLATFGGAVAALLLVRFPAPPPAHVDSAPSLRREIWAGWAYLRGQPGLLGLLLYTALGNFLGVTTEILLQPYVLALAGSVALGWVMALGGGGLLAGSLILGAWGGPRRRLRGVFGFELIVCAGTLLIGLSTAPWAIGATAFAYFAAIALSDGCATALWQSAVPPALQGRVFALREMVGYAALPLGLIVSAPLAEYVFEPLLQPGGAWATTVGLLVGSGPARGIALVFLLAGVVNLLVIAWAWSRPAIRQIEGGDQKAVVP